MSRERVLRAAIAFADEHGLESLTMRKLARSLGVEAMSLYYHVANKRDLVDGIADLVLSEVELPSEDGDWEAGVREIALSTHDTLLRHPWACPLVTSRVLPSRLRYMEWILGRLRDAGFSDELTYRGYHALDSHILGYTLWELGHSAATQNVNEVAATFLRELPRDRFPHVVEHVEHHLAGLIRGGKSEFEFGLDLILDGLARAAP